MAWCNLESCEAQVVQIIEEPSDSFFGAEFNTSA